VHCEMEARFTQAHSTRGISNVRRVPMKVFRSERVQGLVTTPRKASCFAKSEDCLIGGRRHSAGKKRQ
jgi:hypothetical protein